MPRGGLRPASDGSLDHLIKSKWRSGRTTTIRVPIAISHQLLEYAHRLDCSKALDLQQDNIDDLKAKADLAKILLERCEYLEQLGRDTGSQEQAIAVLKAALDLKPNAGGAIKKQIKKALELLEGISHD